MCSNCNRNGCGGRGAIAYQNDGCGCGQVNRNSDCGCGNNDFANNCGCGNNDFANNCGCGNNAMANDCGCRNNNGCGCGIIDSLAKGFACTTNRIVRGLDRSLSRGCNGGGCGGNGCGC